MTAKPGHIVACMRMIDPFKITELASKLADNRYGRDGHLPTLCQGWRHARRHDDQDAAAARVTGAGGSWIVQCRDPRGAFFGMVALGR